MATLQEQYAEKLKEANKKKDNIRETLGHLDKSESQVEGYIKDKETKREHRETVNKIHATISKIKHDFTQLDEGQSTPKNVTQEDIQSIDKIIKEFENIQDQIIKTGKEISKIGEDINEFNNIVENVEQHQNVVAIFGILSGVATIIYGVVDGIIVGEKAFGEIPGNTIKRGITRVSNIGVVQKLSDSKVVLHAVCGLLANLFGVWAVLFSSRGRGSKFDNWDASLTIVQAIPNLIDIVAIFTNKKFDYNQVSSSSENTCGEKTMLIVGAVVGVATIVIVFTSNIFYDANTKTKSMRLVQYVVIGIALWLPGLAYIFKKTPKVVIGLSCLDCVCYTVGGGIQIARSCA